MISFEQALNEILKSVLPLEIESIDFMEGIGRIVRENIVSDLDMPPFKKSAVDGFACKKNNLLQELKIIETIAAGTMPQWEISDGECSRIMTGAPIPPGADMVFMVEDSQLVGTDKVIFIGNNTSANICFTGEDMKKGEVVITEGSKLRGQHIAVLASVGKTKITVGIKPRIGILVTGDELVEPNCIPKGSQIRNSNAWQLLAQCKSMGIEAQYYGIAGDTKEEIKEKLFLSSCENDITLLTGGVSAGEFDFVPEMITKIDFDIVFRQIEIQPGKPLVFAKNGNKYIFGLPGNPVSGFVQFELLVKPLIEKLMGKTSIQQFTSAICGETFERTKANRTSLYPIKLGSNGQIYRIDYNGSAHINSYVEADGFAMIPKDIFKVSKGEPIYVRFI